MPEPVAIPSGATRLSDQEGHGAARTASEIDATLVALIRQALDAPRLQTQPDGHGSGAGGKDAAVNRIGKFEVLGEIGRGGFGTVLLVRDPDLGRERALKVPNPETLGSPGALARFLGEARLTSRIDHPNVVRVYEAETFGVLPYIVMEYCPEGSLGQWLAARSQPDQLPERWVASLVADISEGVHQAHLAGLLHRDIKPGNILLERIRHQGEIELDPPQFRPKIADFGLAKIFEQDGIGRSMTASGTPVGTWAYMSPEQARGEKGILATTDVYAIGAILYELLTGERLYAGLSQTEIVGRLLGPEESPRPAAMRRGLNGELDTICLKCLEKTPRDRYQNPSELANDLRRFLGGLPILARPAPFWKRGLSQVKRHPIRWALTGLALMAVIFGTLALSQFREMKRRGAVDVLLNNLESATVAQFPELIPRIDPADARVADRMNRLFSAGNPPQKLAAALVLAKVRDDYGSYSYERLLAAEPQEIAPLARLLRGRMPELPSRLASDAEAPSAPGASDTDAEDHDRRRATASAALLALDEGDRGWSLFRFSPNPQARSFLVHLLGKSGIDPRRIVDRLASEPDVSVRRALIQSMGEVPETLWDDDLRRRVIVRLLDLYQNDPDAGVHGATKWLLLQWKLDAEVDRIDRSLAARAVSGPRFSWRISPHHLTLITIELPALDRIIELADTEVTVDLFQQFRPDHTYVPEVSPERNCPMNSVNYCDAASFCNWLSAREQVPAEQYCYRQHDMEEGLWLPVADGCDRAGYRLPSDIEFEIACRSGTNTIRYHGDSSSLLSHYARYDQRNGLRTSPVARFKPNDFGLFDMLGNAYEICQSSSPDVNFKNQAAICGGCWVNDDIDVRSSSRAGPVDSNAPNMRGISDRFGFRVARTIRQGRLKR